MPLTGRQEAIKYHSEQQLDVVERVLGLMSEMLGSGLTSVTFSCMALDKSALSELQCPICEMGKTVPALPTKIIGIKKDNVLKTPL